MDTHLSHSVHVFSIPFESHPLKMFPKAKSASSFICGNKMSGISLVILISFVLGVVPVLLPSFFVNWCLTISRWTFVPRTASSLVYSPMKRSRSSSLKLISVSGRFLSSSMKMSGMTSRWLSHVSIRYGVALYCHVSSRQSQTQEMSKFSGYIEPTCS